jgi:hypothetical protein
LTDVTTIGIMYDDLASLSGLGLAAGGANGGHDGGNVQDFAGNIEVMLNFMKLIFLQWHTAPIYRL